MGFLENSIFCFSKQKRIRSKSSDLTALHTFHVTSKWLRTKKIEICEICIRIFHIQNVSINRRGKFRRASRAVLKSAFARTRRTRTRSKVPTPTASFHPDLCRSVLRSALSWVLVACVIDVSRGAIPVKTKTIIGVGGSGTYEEVIAMPCAFGGSGACLRRPKTVSGCLAPFDEEQTLKLRGPMDVLELGVYYPSGGSWNRISYFNRAGGMDNIVFMGNYGRSPTGENVDEGSCHVNPGEQAKIIVNGDDFMCHGYNTSYASPDGKCASRNVQQFGGRLDDNVEVNIMQRATCATGGCGFFRGIGHRGWDGPAGAKMFAIKVRYSDGMVFNAPAMWFLHASVMRTANYHSPGLCNCRGVGSPGGCGELDIAEVVTEKNAKYEVETSIYSFKGAYSDQNSYMFERPSGKEVVYVTIFNKEGYIQVLQLDSSEFSFGGSVSNAVVDALNSRRELIMRMPGSEMDGCGGPKCSYQFSQNGGFAARIEDGVICEDTMSHGRYSLGRRLRQTIPISTPTEDAPPQV